jgi:hypothetical protein
LAAAVLSLGGVARDKPFSTPWPARAPWPSSTRWRSDIAPGLRRRFGFERWATPDQRKIWETLRQRRAREDPLGGSPCPILARDIDKGAIAAARKNAEAAGVLSDITFEVADVAKPARRRILPAPSAPIRPTANGWKPAASGSDVERLYATMARSFDRHGRLACGVPVGQSGVRQNTEAPTDDFAPPLQRSHRNPSACLRAVTDPARDPLPSLSDVSHAGQELPLRRSAPSRALEQKAVKVADPSVALPGFPLQLESAGQKRLDLRATIAALSLRLLYWIS